METSLACGIKVLVGLRGIDHTSVLKVWTLEVNILRVRSDDVGSYVASDVENLLVVLDGVVEVNGCVLKLVFVGEALFLQLDDALHQRMIQVKRYFRVVTIIVCHNFIIFE